MSRFRNWLVCGALGVAAVIACGPFFGIEALRERSELLLAAPTVSFEEELRSLVPPANDRFPVVEDNDLGRARFTRETWETRELPPAALAKVVSMRRQESGDAAYNEGEGLGSAEREYTTGAVFFTHGQQEQAQAHFQRVLDLPNAEKKSRELWAHFMLGRVAVAQGDQAGANKQFDAVRQLVRHGTPDPLGMAVASFGEEARGAWKQGLVGEAVKLYAEQAARGSKNGLSSLLVIAGQILKDNDLLDKAMQDPLARRLVFISLNRNNGEMFFVGPEKTDQTVIEGIVLALQRHNLTKVPGSGLLAAAAYNQGNFEVAERLVHWEDAPISAWVKAKLALRRGDRDGALKNYEKALKGYEGARDTAKVIEAETGVLQVSQQDYEEALDLFYRAAGGRGGFADYWGDAAYLAERVLTVDELKSYVDNKAPATRVIDERTAAEGGAQKRLDVNMSLRSLLARRLMREGRSNEAMHYFDDPDTRQAAKEYDDALSRATSRWRFPTARAEAWFRAATLARTKGIKILGYEREPDWAMWDGEYEPYDPTQTLGNGNDPTKLHAKPKDPYETQDERKRVSRSKPLKNERFHYRFTAAEEAANAADLLPRPSQAFAAVLCAGTQWVIDRDQKQASALYVRYLREGAYVKWGKSFGRSCPQPDFGLTSVWSLPRRARRFEGHLKGHPLGTIGVPAVLSLAGLGFWISRRRRRVVEIVEPWDETPE